MKRRTGGPGVLQERWSPDDTRVEKGALCRPHGALCGNGGWTGARLDARLGATVLDASARFGRRCGRRVGVGTTARAGSDRGPRDDNVHHADDDAGHDRDDGRAEDDGSIGAGHDGAEDDHNGADDAEADHGARQAGAQGGIVGWPFNRAGRA